MNDLLQLAEDYRHYAQKKSNAHYRMAESALASHKRYGIPVSIATAIVGTTIFASLSSDNPSLPIQIGTGVLSLAAAVLSALHTFLNYADTAAQHKAAATAYEGVRHDLDTFILAVGSSVDTALVTDAIPSLRKISEKLDEIASRAPTIPDRIYDAAETRAATRKVLSGMNSESSSSG